MRTGSLWAEALRSAWATKVSTLLVLLVTASMCFAAIATAGRGAANQAEIQAQLAASGSRQLRVIDTQRVGVLTDSALALVAGIDRVSHAVSLTVPVDAWNGATGPGSTRLALWQVRGDLAPVGELVRGRMPQPGEALVSRATQARMGLAEPVGWVNTAAGDQYPIVGAYEPAPPYEDLGNGVVVAGGPGMVGGELRVLFDHIDAVAAAQRGVLVIVAPQTLEGVRVESPLGLAETARQLDAQLAQNGRAQLLLILGVGALFVAAVVFADVLVRRRDLGRRRTLGITRADLITLVTARTLVPSVVGVLLGCAAGWVSATGVGVHVPLDFTAAVGVLTVECAAVAALAPAWFASRVDPVVVMRTP